MNRRSFVASLVAAPAALMPTQPVLGSMPKKPSFGIGFQLTREMFEQWQDHAIHGGPEPPWLEKYLWWLEWAFFGAVAKRQIVPEPDHDGLVATLELRVHGQSRS